MNRLFAFLLSRYDPRDQELLLKAKFVLITTLVVIFCLTLIMVYTSYLAGISSTNVLVEITGFIVMLGALGFLLKGNYIFAVHTIFITGFSVPWLIMFTESADHMLVKLDTIVFIIGLLAAMPLMFFQDRRPMVVYFFANLGIFGVFLYHMNQTLDLTRLEFFDYMADNTIAMFFVFAVAFNLFAIYRNALNSLKKELQERQKAELALTQLQILLSNTLNSMPSAVIGINRTFHILLWNEEAETLTGKNDSDVNGLDLFEVFPQLIGLKEKVQQVMNEHIISQKFKTRLEFPKQTQVVDITIYPIVQSDSGGVVIRLDDISERLHMEEMMVQSEKMISVGGLAAGMAHEINNPLSGMIQSAQVIQNRLTKPVPANQSVAQAYDLSMEQLSGYMKEREIFNLLDNIYDAGVRAAKIVENMLGFVKKEHSPKEKQDMAVLIDEAITLAENDYDLKKKYDFKHIEIERTFQSDLPRVACAKSKILQVLFNLLKNASEALASEALASETLASEGRVSKDKYCRGRIILRLYEALDKVCIEVEDNGPGINEETRKRVFEPFFTTKPVDQGTGLGLSVSYFIITEDHGGQMEVEKSQGRGTRFIIRLPIDSSASG